MQQNILLWDINLMREIHNYQCLTLCFAIPFFPSWITLRLSSAEMSVNALWIILIRVSIVFHFLIYYISKEKQSFRAFFLSLAFPLPISPTGLPSFVFKQKTQDLWRIMMINYSFFSHENKLFVLNHVYSSL